MAATARQKRLYLHHQGEFQHKNCTLGSLNDSDHDGVGRFFVGHSQGSVRLFIYLHYAAQFFLYQECNITRHNFSYTRSVTRGNRTPGGLCNAAVASP